MKQAPAYRAPEKFVHWFVALCALALVPIGLVMMRIGEGPTQDRLYFLHTSFGAVVLALMIVRVGLKAAGRMPPPSAVLTPFERRASQGAHLALYALLIATPMAGWLGVSAFGAQPNVFDLFSLPALTGKNEALSHRLFAAHLAGAILIALVALLHIAGALVHARRRDGVLSRMLPGRWSI